jgi:glycogen operon protein
MIATVFLSQGTPMLLAGDEFGRTQNGNNNAYAQDNETSWIDWRLADSKLGRLLTDFTARVIALRHRHPVLRCANFLHGKDKPAPDVLDIAWFDEHGQGLSPEAWDNPQERTLVLRRATPAASGTVPILTCLFNPMPDDRTFKLPPPRFPTRLLLDSADPAGAERDIDGETVAVKARSVVLVRSVYRK